jgi:glutathione S-transferase
MLLYNSQVSGNCYKVRLLLAQLGIDYERHELSVVDRSNRAELLGELNPALRVPTLVLDDGRAIAESNAIIYYFASGTRYLPEDPMSAPRCCSGCSSSSTATSPTSPWFASGSHSPRARRRPEIEARRAGGYLALDAMERMLSTEQFLVGERYTIADIALYAYTHVAGEAASSSSAIRRSAPGWPASPSSRDTSRSAPDQLAAEVASARSRARWRTAT